MPPAFNLSQDQTLQFNLCYFAVLPALLLLRGRSLKILTGHYFRSAYFITSCEHLIFFKYRGTEAPRALPSNVHTYRLLIFKELGSRRGRYCVANKSFCLSAKKEEYESFRPFRQPSFSSRFTLQHLVLCAPFCEEANYSKAPLGLARTFFTPSASTAINNAPAPTPINKRWSPPLCANR